MLHWEKFIWAFITSFHSLSSCIARTQVVGSRTLGGDQVALGGDIQVNTLVGTPRVALVGKARVL